MKNKPILKKISLLLFFFILISNIQLAYGKNIKPTKPQKIYVDAKAAIAVDSENKTVLFEKNANTLIPIASTTKIMTTLVAIKYGNLDKQVEISKRSANIHGSTVGYKKGEKVSIRELLYGLMLRSGNDAAIAIAEGVAGNVDSFVNLMNEYAIEIGLSNTHYESPHGLDSENHYSTAYDLALVTAKAKENNIFNTIVSSKDVDAKSNNFTRSYHNINKILYRISGANGVKTGYTGNAGKCLVSSVNLNGKDIVIVVLNCTPRWKETTKIFNYVKKNYEYKKLYSKDDPIAKVPVNKTSNYIILSIKEDLIIPLKKDTHYDVKISKPKVVDKKVKKGDKVGKLSIYNKDSLIFSKSLIVK